MYILFVSIQIIGVALAFWALVLLLNGDTTYGQKMMSYFIFSELIQNAGYLLELTSRTPEASMVAVKIQYLGACFVMLYFSMFIF